MNYILTGKSKKIIEEEGIKKMATQNPRVLLITLMFVFISLYGHTQTKSLELRNLGIEFLFVQGGTFDMGDLWEAGYSKDESPVHTVTMSPFWMSQYEITNAQFCIFLNEKGNVVEGGAPWIDITDKDCPILQRGKKFSPKRGYWYYPVVEVTWYGAKAFAEWLGCRLPTEAEWEYAARAEGMRIMYPNGHTIDHNDANFAGKGGGDRWDMTSPIGSFPPNPIGLYDMAGNVWERCHDFYEENYYSQSPDKDPQGPPAGTYHVMRGGSWDYSGFNCRTTIRGINTSDYASNDIGFRIVRDVE
jgi:formylglycine-generating enzyme required for sulfatase activity